MKSVLLSFLCLWLVSVPVWAGDNDNHIPEVSADDLAQAVQARVIDPYLELHTGPGRGYPVIYVVEKGELISVISRRTTWYLIADARGKTGWVKRESLARTLVDTGVPVALPETRHADFLHHRVRLGFALGRQEQADQVAGIAGFRLTRHLGIEAELAQLFSPTTDGYQQSLSLIVEPTDRWAFTPFVSLGYGRQELELKQKLPGTRPVTDEFRSFGAGVNVYIGFNFVLRGEYRHLDISSANDTVSNGVWRVGFSSFF